MFDWINQKHKGTKVVRSDVVQDVISKRHLKFNLFNIWSNHKCIVFVVFFTMQEQKKQEKPMIGVKSYINSMPQYTLSFLGKETIYGLMEQKTIITRHVQVKCGNWEVLELHWPFWTVLFRPPVLIRKRLCWVWLAPHHEHSIQSSAHHAEHKWSLSLKGALQNESSTICGSHNEAFGNWLYIWWILLWLHHDDIIPHENYGPKPSFVVKN